MTDVVTCPAGHPSRSTDYCDECGLPIPPAPPVAPVRPAATAPANGQRCPSCGTFGPADALFCEACGYDFTTGTMPRGTASELLGLTRPSADRPTPPTPDTPAATTPDTPTGGSEPVPAPAPTAAPDAATPVQSRPVAAPSSAAPRPPEPEEAEIPTAGSPLARPGPSWVAEVWVDPDWYRLQSSPDPLPSPGRPEVFPLPAGGGLIGRASRSQHLVPEVDCGTDTGCSRRQALLIGDGRRWWVEDLDSANGTFVGLTGDPLPTSPMPSGRVELTPDSRIYVGAWTRIVVRPATAGEESAAG